MKIALGADSAGKPLIDVIEAYLKEKGAHQVSNLSRAGYYADIVRMIPGAPNGTSDLIIATALQEFIGEKATILSLGLAPLAKLAPCSNEPLFMRRLLSLLYVAGNRIYSFKGNYFHKEKYRGEEVPVFYTTKHRNAFGELLRVFRLVGVF